MSEAGPRVRVGIGLVTAEVPPGSGRAPADEYSGTLRIAERAEELGFDSLWTSEHHGVSDGYLPSQLVLLSAVAAVTARMRLGTGVLVAPVHEPLRLAEDAAVLDQLSRGRLTLGLGLGWRAEEYRMFGVPARVGLVDRHAPDRTELISASLAYQLGVYSALHSGDDTPGRGFRPRAVTPETVAASALWGTPEHVAAELAALVLAARPARRCELVLRLGYPGMDLPGSLRLLELFSGDVLPRLHETLTNQER